MRCALCNEHEMLLDIHTGQRHAYMPGNAIKSLQCSRCTQRMLRARSKPKEEKKDV